MRSDDNLNKRFAEEKIDPRQYASMPGVIDTSKEIDGKPILRSHSFSGKESNSVFLNREGEGFEDISGVTGLDSLADGRAFAYFDFDHDGRNDIVLTNTNNPQLQLFQNQIKESGSSIVIRLVGGNRTARSSEEWSSRDAFGAHVIVKAGDKKLLRELRAGDGFAAQNSSTLTIGLGEASGAEKVVIRWPSGKVSNLGDVATGTRVTIYENPDESAPVIESLEPIKVPNIKTKLPLEDKLSLPVEKEINVVVTLATWCPVCRGEVAHFDKLIEDASKEFGFYAVPIDPKEGFEDFLSFEKELNPSYQILKSTTSSQRAEVEALMKKNFGEHPLPSTFILDRKGRVLEAMKGTPTLSQIRLRLDWLR